MVFWQKWVSMEVTAANVRALLHDIQRSKEVQNLLLNDDIMTDHDKFGKGKKSSQGFFKLNCYGSYLQGAVVASCGVVIGNSQSIFLQAFSRRLNHCSILEAKLWAIFYGLTMATNLDVQNLIVESDCVEVIQLLDEGDVSSSQFKYLLIEILKVKGQFQLCYYKHIIREANMLVDSFSMVYL